MWIKRMVYEDLLRKAITDATLVGVQTDTIAALKSRVKELSDRLDAERLRSDEAVDQMLRVKGLPSVAPTEKPPSLEELSDLFAEDPDAVREIVGDIKDRGAATVLLEGSRA